MVKQLTKEQTYDKCVSEGLIIPQAEINIDKAKSMLKIAEEYQEAIKDIKNKWITTYQLNYNIIHTLCEILLIFDKTKSNNHQCLFTYICVKHPELELDWDFFEKIRTRRNGIHYYGAIVTKNDWKEIELQSQLYINLLKKEINKRLDT